MKRKILYILAIFLFPVITSSQEITNIRFEQNGKQINLYYDLKGTETFSVWVFCSTDDGRNWGQPLKYVYGDVGENQEPGKQKMIVWNVLSEREELTSKILFKIEAEPSSKGIFEDIRDGQIYKWVKIGDQVWMAENLNYNNGRGSYCYNKKDSNCNIFGRLYEWRKALDVCPSGWHLPSDKEWKQLEKQLGMSQKQVKLSEWRGTTEGKILKSSDGWFNNGNGNNNVNFSALPGGYLYNDKHFNELHKDGNWWTNTEYSLTDAWARGLYYQYEKLRRHHGNKNDGFSVRCIRD